MSFAQSIVRPEVLALEPYASAIWDPTFERLHANECPWRFPGDFSQTGLNRYPPPYADNVEAQLAALYGVDPVQLIAARGADECIDLLLRAFCIPGTDAVLTCPPTFGMYSFAARVQGAQILEAPLLRSHGYALDEGAIVQTLTPTVKLFFLCSPNNPTGNVLGSATIQWLLTKLSDRALVVVDEAYVEYSSTPSFISRLREFPNLVVLRTLSKAYALAGARCGALIASPDITSLVRRIIPPYAIPSPTGEAVLKALEPLGRAAARGHIGETRRELADLAATLRTIVGVRKVWPSEANFLLVEFDDAARALALAREHGLLVRDISGCRWTPSCLRISIGTPEQNDRLIAALAAISSL